MADAKVETLEVGGFVLTPTEFVPRQGRSATPSPFLPLVKASVENGNAAYSFPMSLNGKNADERKADLEKVIRAIRRAGGQLDPPVTVQAQAGDIGKDGTVEITFNTRDKISKSPKTETTAA